MENVEIVVAAAVDETTLNFKPSKTEDREEKKHQTDLKCVIISILKLNSLIY